jgi:hypothetical protein
MDGAYGATVNAAAHSPMRTSVILHGEAVEGRVLTASGWRWRGAAAAVAKPLHVVRSTTPVIVTRLCKNT